MDGRSFKYVAILRDRPFSSLCDIAILRGKEGYVLSRTVAHQGDLSSCPAWLL